MATIPETKVHFSIQHPDIPSYFAKAFSIIVWGSRPPREAKFGYNPDPRSRTYRFVNARNGKSGPGDSKGLAEALQGGLVNTRDGQERLPRQLLSKCTFSVGIVAMARYGTRYPCLLRFPVMTAGSNSMWWAVSSAHLWDPAYSGMAKLLPPGQL